MTRVMFGEIIGTDCGLLLGSRRAVQLTKPDQERQTLVQEWS